MATYLVRRLLLMIPTLIGITFLVFVIVASAPGGIGAALQAAGGGGNLQASSGVAVQQAYLEDRYGLADPIVVQYVRWLGRISPLKFGPRDQVLPNGELARQPREIKAPPLWEWFAEELPAAPSVSVEPLAPLSGLEDAVRADAERSRLLTWRRAERASAESRFALLEATTMLKSALRDYAREADIENGIADDLQPRLSVIAATTPRPELPSWSRVKALGEQSIQRYANAQAARANVLALFSAKPFVASGVPILPKLLWIGPPDFGTAFSRNRPSMDLIADHLPVTLLLNVIAIPIIYLVAVPSGMLAAINRGSFFDVGLGSIYVALYSFPVVLAGVLAIGFLASKDYLGAFPVAGLSSTDHESLLFLPRYNPEGQFEPGFVLDILWHMALPVLCLVYTGFAVLSKQTRAAMLENFNADYVRTARAKGVPNKDVILRHVFRNSLLPLITMFVTVFPAMLAGSVVIERVFSIQGMGWLVIEAVNFRDRELLLANTVMIAAVNLVALLAADILYAFADPRVAYD